MELAMIIVWAITGVAWMERSLRSVIQVLPGRDDDHGHGITRLLTPFYGTTWEVQNRSPTAKQGQVSKLPGRESTG